MKVSVVIASHGADEWRRLAQGRAYPSACMSGADEILIDHGPDETRAQVRNRLTVDAAGDYIVTLDADDELSVGYCEEIWASWSPSGDWLITPRVQYIRGHRVGAPHFLPHGEIWEDNWMVVGTAFPRALFLKVGGWRTLMGTGVMNEADDWDLWGRMINEGAGITYCEKAVYRAYVDRPSVHRSTGRHMRQRWADEIRRLNWPDKAKETVT